MSKQDVIKKVLLEAQPTKEFVTIEQIANTSLFLCSDNARQITGTNISMEWRLDRTVSKGRTSSNGTANGRGSVKPKTGRQKHRSNGSGQKSRSINLGLQGGGAHGAFSWGVLDRILEDGRLEIEGISGTSAGAMNAVVLADALYDGSAEYARERLYQFWRSVSTESLKSPIQRSALDVFFQNWNLDHNPAFIFYDLMTRLVSPYEFNPLNIDPLKDILESQVNFEPCTCLRQDQDFHLRHQCTHRTCTCLFRIGRVAGRCNCFGLFAICFSGCGDR